MERGHFWAVLFWFVATGVVNWMMRTKTAEEWEALAEKSPRYAAFARMLRSVGLDPVKLIQALADFVRGRARSVVARPKQNDDPKDSSRPADDTPSLESAEQQLSAAEAAAGIGDISKKEEKL